MFVTIAWVHRRDLAGGRFMAPAPAAPHLPAHPRTIALGWAACLLVAFVAGAPVATAALVVGAGVLLTAGPRGRHVLARVDVSLLTLFAGLFVVVGAPGHSGLTSIAAAWWGAPPGCMASGSSR